MKRYGIWILICLAPLVGWAQDEQAAAECVHGNIKALNNEDIEAMMGTLHPQAPSGSASRRQTQQIFTLYDLTYTVDSIKVVGRDTDYLYVRVKQSTRKAKPDEGPAFRNNSTDLLHALKKDGDRYKIWTSAVLGVAFEKQP